MVCRARHRAASVALAFAASAGLVLAAGQETTAPAQDQPQAQQQQTIQQQQTTGQQSTQSTQTTTSGTGSMSSTSIQQATPPAEQPKFDLDVSLNLDRQWLDKLHPGDSLRVILRPEVQYGARTSPGEPIVMERRFAPDVPTQQIKFEKALAPDQIYRLEMQIVRADDPQHPIKVRYLSALDKLPRKPVADNVKMRLFLGDQKDQRDNHVYVTRDKDGVYRMMIFTA